MSGSIPSISRWVASFPAEIIVCDADGTIIEMNDVAIDLYQSQGGAGMIGRNVFDHHSEPSRSQVQTLVAQRKPVIYTTEKGGQKKLVCIAPWLQDHEYAGFALLTLDLPADMQNICKD
jgi:PAS domain-containing protein